MNKIPIVPALCFLHKSSCLRVWSHREKLFPSSKELKIFLEDHAIYKSSKTHLEQKMKRFFLLETPSTHIQVYYLKLSLLLSLTLVLIKIELIWVVFFQENSLTIRIISRGWAWRVIIWTFFFDRIIVIALRCLLHL